MSILTDVFLPLALAFIMFALGLGLTGADFLRVIKQPRDFFVGTFSQIILLPIIAFVLVKLFSVSPELAIGVIDYEGNEKLMGGPLSAIEKHSKKYVSIRPGFVDRNIVAKKLSDSFEIDTAEVERLLPSGGFEIKKSFGLEIKLE